MVKGEIVKFLTKDGIELQGFLVDSKSKAGFLHIHGLSGNFYDNPFTDFVADLAKKNKITFLSMNTRGHDYVNDLTKFEGHRHRIVNIGGALERFEDCLIDIKAGINFLKSGGCKKIILQGHSSGCQRIVYYQSETEDKSVIGLILLAPADDMNIIKKILGSSAEKILKSARNRTNKGDYNLIMQNVCGLPVMSAGRLSSLADPASVEAQLFNYEGKMAFVRSLEVPVLAIFGSKDIYLTMPAEKMLNILKSKVRKCTTAAIENAPHNFRGHEARLVSVIDKWLRGVI